MSNIVDDEEAQPAVSATRKRKRGESIWDDDSDDDSNVDTRLDISLGPDDSHDNSHDNSHDDAPTQDTVDTILSPIKYCLDWYVDKR